MWFAKRRFADTPNSPGWVFTGMSGANDPTKTKPPGAWTPEQTVEYMFEKVLFEDDFYVICPDNETTSVSSAPASLCLTNSQAVDKARIQWSLGDIIEGRPALSRWHPACELAYDYHR